MSVFNNDFTDEIDGTPLTAITPAWLGSGDNLEILNEAVVYSGTTTGWEYNYAPISPASADQQVAFVSNTAAEAGTHIAACLRMSSDGENRYYALYDSGSWRILKRTAGNSEVQLGAFVFAPTASDVAVIFKIVGTTLTLSINSSVEITVSDSDISAAGEWGLATYYVDKAGTIDNLAYSDVVVDVTAPALSNPTATKTGQSTATGTVDTDDQTGTLYYLVNANAGAPNAVVVSSGINQSVEAQVTQSISISGLTPSTLYYIHYVQVDPSGNLSATANSGSFTTDALSLSIDTTPSSIIPGTSATIIIADPATAPTLGNTSINFVGDAVDASVTNVTDDGGGLYSITFNFSHTTMPDVAYGLRTLVVTVGAESANSSGLQFVSPAGFVAILITDVSNSDLGISVPALAVSDQIEYETTEGDIALAIDANAVATVTASNSATPNNEQFSIRAWDATDGVWGAWAVYVAVNDDAGSVVTITDAADASLEYANGSGGLSESSASVGAWKAGFINATSSTHLPNDSTLTAANSPYIYTFTAIDAVDVIGVLTITEAEAVTGSPQITSDSVVSLDEGAGANATVLDLEATGDGSYRIFTITDGDNAGDYNLQLLIDGNFLPYYRLRRNTSADYDIDAQEFVEVTATGDVSPPAVQLITININEIVEPATVAPTITPTDGTTLALDVGDAYSDPAWTHADDVVSGQAVAWSWVGSAIDVNAVGTYTRRATATNAIGTVTLDLVITVSAIAGVAVINIQGSSILFLSVGEPFDLPIFTATDAVGDDVTDLVVVTNPVNTLIANSYSVDFQLFDNAVLIAEKSITVIVSSASSGKFVVVENGNLSQGETKEIEKKALFIGVGATNTNQTLYVNAESDLDVQIGTVDNEFRRNVLAAQKNGGAAWEAYLRPIANGDDWRVEIDVAMQTVSPELVLITTPSTASSDLTNAYIKAESLRTTLARRVVVLLAAAGIDAATQTWPQYIAAMDEIVGGVAANRCAVVPLLHGNDLGALAGRLCREELSISDSPARVASGALFVTWSDVVDSSGVPLDSATLAALDNMRMSVPHRYIDFDGWYWADCNLLEVEGGDYQVIEYLRPVDKAARMVRIIEVAMIADRSINSTATSVAYTKNRLLKPLRDMSKSTVFLDKPMPGDIDPPNDNSVRVVWLSKTKLETYLSIKPSGAPKEILTRIYLDLSNP